MWEVPYDQRRRITDHIRFFDGAWQVLASTHRDNAMSRREACSRRQRHRRRRFDSGSD